MDIIAVTEDPNVIPVRVVNGKAAQNSAGQWIDTLPIQGGIVRLRTLPLATGSKVMGLGHSFIGLGAAQTYTAGQTATNGHTGFYENGRTVLS